MKDISIEERKEYSIRHIGQSIESHQLLRKCVCAILNVLPNSEINTIIGIVQ